VTIEPPTISADSDTATFTMPAKAVEVTATFSDIPSTLYPVSITPSGAAGTEEVTESVNEATEGTTITLTASLGEGRRVALSADSVTIAPSTISADGDTATFTMPASAVEINDYGDSMTNLIRSNRDPDFPWLGVLIGSSVIGFWYWCTDQFIVQRVLSGKNETQARRGTILGAYLKLTPVFLFMIPGMIAFVIAQKGITINGEVFTLSSSDAAFPTLVSILLPAGVKGLVVCGILAALMSSLASLFNSSAMLFTIDFYKKYRPQATEKKLLYICYSGHFMDTHNEKRRKCFV